MRLVFVLLGVFLGFVGAIRTGVGAKPQCFFEDFWAPEKVVGKWTWSKKAQADTTVKVWDYVNNIMLFNSADTQGQFEVTNQYLKVCFEQQPGEICKGWRQTGQCNPHGPREREKDRSCDVKVEAGASGFCTCVKQEMKGGQVVEVVENKYFTCDHDGLVCNDICADAVLKAAVTFDLIQESRVLTAEKLADAKDHRKAERLMSTMERMFSRVREDMVASADRDLHTTSSIDRANGLVVWLRIFTIVVFASCLALQAYAYIALFRARKVI